MVMTENIIKHNFLLNFQDREKLNRHKGACLWFTGLSGSGKSTIANLLDKALYDLEIHSYILDGDNIRTGLNQDLGFSPQDRVENIRRIGHVSKLFVDSGILVLTSFISPYRQDRDSVRELFDIDRFIEIYVKCSLDVCKSRDPKGLYKKAMNGEIQDFTGISAPYEEPIEPEIVLENNDNNDLETSVKRILDYLRNKNIISV